MTDLGITLIVVALVLLLAEAHLSTGGLIGAVSIVAGIGGITLLLLAAGVGAVVVLTVALCAAAGAVPLLLLARRRIMGSLHTRPRTGREALVGHLGVVRSGEESPSQLQVFVDGSLWRAEPDPFLEEPELHNDDRIVVERVNGLTLRVRKAEQWELNP